MSVNLRRHLKQQAATGDAPDAFHRQVNGIIEVDQAVHVVGPSGDAVAGLLALTRLHQVLRHGRQPHAVDEGVFQARHPSRSVRGVDGVEVAGNIGECRHVCRCDDPCAAQLRARGVGDSGRQTRSGGHINRY